MEVLNMEATHTVVKPAGNGGFDHRSPVNVPVSTPALTPVGPRRYLDPHSIRHAKLPKTALAIAGAEVLDGHLQLLNPTIEIVAKAVGVSSSYITAARKLTPEQRREVLAGKRPLGLLKPPAPAVNVGERFAAIVAELGGVAEALDQLAVIERNGNGHGVTVESVLIPD
jgi:hypothetical protein